MENSPYWTIPYWTIGAEQDPYWTIFQESPYWTIFQESPYWTIFNESPYWTLIQNNPYWTIFFSSPYWTIGWDSDPYWTIPSSDPYWTIFTESPYWTLFQESPYWTLFQESPYWTIFNESPYWTLFFTSPYWTLFQSSPYWTIGEDLAPFWTIFQDSPYWTLPGIAPYWTIPYWTLPYWTIGKTNFKEFKSTFESLFGDLGGGKEAKKVLKHEYKAYKEMFKDGKKSLKKWKKEMKEMRKAYDPTLTWNLKMVLGNNPEFDKDFNIQIAILDSGVDTSHPDLNDNVKWVYDATGRGDPADHSGHGTHIAGIIAAEKNDFGITGLAPYADLYSIKVIDAADPEGEWEWAVEGIYAAVRGPDGIVGTEDDAEVITMSFDSRGEVPPAFVHEAIQYAYDHGVALIAAAGNAGDGDLTTTEPPTYPASYDEVISVGAVDIYGVPANYSNNLENIEIMAPGHFIYSTYLGGDYVWWGGTSMAAPHVAAVVALIMNEYGRLPVGGFNDLGMDTIRGILHAMAANYPGSTWNPYYGYGIVQYHEGLLDD